MLPLPQPPGPRCDCCGAPIHLQAGDFCPRCGYPVSMPKEEHFLDESIRNLQRIATYGGAQATVTNLLQRYQVRLSAIRRQLYAAPTRQNVPSIPRSEVVLSPSVERPVAPVYVNNQLPLATDMPRVSAEHESVAPAIPVQMPVASVSSAPQQMFSLRFIFCRSNNQHCLFAWCISYSDWFVELCGDNDKSLSLISGLVSCSSHLRHSWFCLSSLSLAFGSSHAFIPQSSLCSFLSWVFLAIDL